MTLPATLELALAQAAEVASYGLSRGERGVRAALVAAARLLGERGVGHISNGPFHCLFDETPNPISCSGLVAWCAHRAFGATESQLQQVGVGRAEHMWKTPNLYRVPLYAAKTGDLVFYVRDTVEGEEWHVMMLANHWRIVGSCPLLRRDEKGYGLVVEHGLLAYERETPWRRVGAKAFPVRNLVEEVATPRPLVFAFGDVDFDETP